MLKQYTTARKHSGYTYYVNCKFPEENKIDILKQLSTLQDKPCILTYTGDIHKIIFKDDEDLKKIVDLKNNSPMKEYLEIPDKEEEIKRINWDNEGIYCIESWG